MSSFGRRSSAGLLLLLSACTERAPVSPLLDSRPRALVAGDTATYAWIMTPYITFRPALNGTVRIQVFFPDGRLRNTCGGAYLNGGRDRTVLTATSCVRSGIENFYRLQVDAWETASTMVRRSVTASVMRDGYPSYAYGASSLTLLYLNDSFPSTIRRYDLSASSTDFLRPFFVAGFGRSGNAIVGDAYGPPMPLLRNDTLLISGNNLFDTSCNSTGEPTACVPASAPDRWRGGSLLLADQDVRGGPSTGHPGSHACFRLGICVGAMFMEASPGRDEVGVPAITTFNQVMAINIGQAPPVIEYGLAGTTSRYVCVGAWGTENQGCQASRNWIMARLQ